MDKQFYQQNRRTLLGKQGEKEGLVVIFGSSAPYKNSTGYYGRALDMNFFYLTGLKTSSSIIAMWRENGNHHEQLFIERPDPDEEKWSGIRMPVTEAAKISGIDEVVHLDEFDTFYSDMLTSPGVNTLYLDIPEWFEEDVPAPIDAFIRRTKRKHPDIDINNVRDILSDMRTVKQPGEIECIRKAVAITRAGIEAMMRAVRPGMYEYQLQAVCHNLLHDRGEMRAAPMVAAGANAVILHYPNCASVIKESDLVLIDFCPRWNYYAADISRAFPAAGRFSYRQKELYKIALEANKQMIEVVEPGMSFRKMNELARRFLGDGMLSIGLISSRDEVETYYYHSVSHYMGLGIHDVGNTDMPIPEGAVLTLDAGVYVAEEGIGMRVEDDVLITNGGCENLSNSIVKEIEDVEASMASA